MNLTVVRVVLEVPVCYLRGVLDESSNCEVEMVVEVVHVANFVHHKLDAMAWDNRTEAEGIKGRLLDLL